MSALKNFAAGLSYLKNQKKEEMGEEAAEIRAAVDLDVVSMKNAKSTFLTNVENLKESRDTEVTSYIDNMVSLHNTIADDLIDDGNRTNMNDYLDLENKIQADYAAFEARKVTEENIVGEEIDSVYTRIGQVQDFNNTLPSINTNPASLRAGE